MSGYSKKNNIQSGKYDQKFVIREFFQNRSSAKIVLHGSEHVSGAYGLWIVATFFKLDLSLMRQIRSEVAIEIYHNVLMFRINKNMNTACSFLCFLFSTIVQYMIVFYYFEEFSMQLCLIGFIEF